MEVRQLRYFVHIAHHGSFSRASLVLHIAQPALSQQIAQLEAELGQPLFHRRHHGVVLTEQGQALLAHAHRILKSLDELPAVVAAPARELRGTVSVGLPQSTALQYASHLLQDAAVACPGVRLEFFDEISGNLLRGLESGRLDLALVVSDDDARMAQAMPLIDEDLFYVSSQPGAPATMPVAQLATMPLALPGYGHGVRALVDAAIRSQGAVPGEPLVEANSIAIMKWAVQAGLAGSVMPWAAIADDLRAGTLAAVPLEPRLSRRVHVCTPRGQQPTLAAAAIQRLLVASVRSRVSGGSWQGARLVPAD